jgi:Domain of unknown function (DUF6791)/ThiF family
MSQQLINRSSDLKRLKDDGYDVEVRSSHLLIKQVPYVNAKKEVQYGILVSQLDLAGDVTATPSTHVAYFMGDHPCHKDGSKIRQIEHGTATRTLDRDLVVNHSFSSKPPGGYKDYYEKMATYIAIISSPAQAINPTVTATPYPVIESIEEESVFNYIDTASSRAGINLVTRKLELGKIAIVGLGGTGSYVLDLVAKTPVREIHLFDGDKFSQHNAFRSPGAPSIDELRERPQKVAYLRGRYLKMHRNIVAHDYFIDPSNVEQLRGMDFVFLCLDKGLAKKLIVAKLEEIDIPFIDVGMGVLLIDDSLRGILRITTSSTNRRDHVRNKNRIPFTDGDGNNDYDRNIQVADLNALNAALAVVKWKKLFGFYHDLDNEHFCTYTIDGNMLTNEDPI